MANAEAYTKQSRPKKGNYKGLPMVKPNTGSMPNLKEFLMEYASDLALLGFQSSWCRKNQNLDTLYNMLKKDAKGWTEA